MEYFLDTEFIDDGRMIDLISIGIVSEDGRQYYGVSNEFVEEKASEWVKTNVLSNLNHNNKSFSKTTIKRQILEFIGESKPEFWGYFCDYDWVVFCQLFGKMIDLPKGWPMMMRDLRQWLDDKGHTNISQPDDMIHNALSDARWISETYKKFKN